MGVRMIGRRVDSSWLRKLGSAAAIVALLLLTTAAIVRSQTSGKTAGKGDDASTEKAPPVGGSVDVFNAREPEPSGNIPTVSEWGVAIMALLLLTGGKIYFTRRRRATA